MDSTPTAAAQPFRPLSAEFARDPYPAYAALRSKTELEYFPNYNMWLVPWHREVSEILNTSTMVRTLDQTLSEEELRERQEQDNWHDMPYHSRFVQFSMLDSDGPVHDRLRAHIADAFGPTAISRLRSLTQSFIDELLEAVAQKRTIDFIEDFAAHIPGRTIGALIGVPKEDCAQLRMWSEHIVQFFDIDRSDRKKQLAESTTKQFYLYLNNLKARRLSRPEDDLLTRLAQLEAQNAISEDEFISTCMLIVMAGHGSTLDVLGSGLHTLLRSPEQLAQLRAKPDLMPTAVQEIFRFEPPLPFFHRYTTVPTVLRGQEFDAGARFGLLYASANRDETVFEDANTFDIARRPNRHKSFGGGAHFCLGNHLARMNLEMVFSSLLRRFNRIELLEQPEYKQGLSVRGPKALHVALHSS